MSTNKLTLADALANQIFCILINEITGERLAHTDMTEQAMDERNQRLLTKGVTAHWVRGESQPA